MRCWPFHGAKAFHVKVLLLDQQELIEEVQPEKTTGQILLNRIFQHLNLIETAYFGLRYQDNANQTDRLKMQVWVSQCLQDNNTLLYINLILLYFHQRRKTQLCSFDTRTLFPNLGWS